MNVTEREMPQGRNNNGYCGTSGYQLLFYLLKYMTISFAIPVGLCIAKLLYYVCFSALEANYNWFSCCVHRLSPMHFSYCAAKMANICFKPLAVDRYSCSVLVLNLQTRQENIRKRNTPFVVRKFLTINARSSCEVWCLGHTDEQEKRFPWSHFW